MNNSYVAFEPNDGNDVVYVDDCPVPRNGDVVVIDNKRYAVQGDPQWVVKPKSLSDRSICTVHVPLVQR